MVQLVSVPGLVLATLYAAIVTLFLAAATELRSALLDRGDLSEYDAVQTVLEEAAIPGIESLLPAIDASFPALVALVVASLVLEIYVTIVAVRAFLAGDRLRPPVSHGTSGIVGPFVNLVFGGVVALALVAVGLGLGVVPGIFLLVSLLFTPVFIVDKRENFYAAMKDSWGLARGNRWPIFWLLLFTVAMSNLLASLPRLATNYGLTSNLDQVVLDWLNLLAVAPALLFLPAAIVVAYVELSPQEVEESNESDVDDEAEADDEDEAGEGDEGGHEDGDEDAAEGGDEDTSGDGETDDGSQTDDDADEHDEEAMDEAADEDDADDDDGAVEDDEDDDVAETAEEGGDQTDEDDGDGDESDEGTDEDADADDGDDGDEADADDATDDEDESDDADADVDDSDDDGDADDTDSEDSDADDEG